MICISELFAHTGVHRLSRHSAIFLIVCVVCATLMTVCMMEFEKILKKWDCEEAIPKFKGKF
jgi:protein-S-isoprenylcysteine O-methyltransferase Ste14